MCIRDSAHAPQEHRGLLEQAPGVVVLGSGSPEGSQVGPQCGHQSGDEAELAQQGPRRALQHVADSEDIGHLPADLLERLLGD
eukprot:1774420-Alexandrium_andersonii.AAC.1